MVGMEETVQDAVNRILALGGSEGVQFIFLYGSVALGKAHKGSDIDLCIGFKGSEREALDFILKVLSAINSDMFDVKLFRHLPLYIKADVFKGKLLFSRDMQDVYRLAYDTMNDYEEFRAHFYDYIGKEVIH
ncbi:MAG TPA: nucleotidyltransferase domain-containing protein [Thermoplasmataceae archaeon]|nr:nucleotidyltransferase domain-containing protein [Thermoplasmataceae archaeon]